MPVQTEQPTHDEQLLSAVERTLAQHNLRLKPGQSLESVVGALETQGCKVSAEHGQLILENNGGAVHPPRAFEKIAADNAAMFFPRDVSTVRSRDELDLKGRVAFIRDRGIDEWEKLPATAAKVPPVVLDPRRMTAAQWRSLDRKTRAELAGKWSPEQIGQILRRTK